MNSGTDLFTTYLRHSVVAFSFSVTSLVVCPAIAYAEEGGLEPFSRFGPTCIRVSLTMKTFLQAGQRKAALFPSQSSS